MSRRRIFIVVTACLVGLSVLDHAGVFGHQAGDRSRYQDVVATVTYAADGDTLDIDLSDGGRPVTRIRLWGVDCPEIAHGEGERDAHFGREATDFIREQVVGERVRIALDPNREPRDKYGRLLAYVYLVETDEMVNEILIQEGLGYADRRFPHVFKHRFLRLEKGARKTGAGLWLDVMPEQMPAWRQRMDAVGAR